MNSTINNKAPTSRTMDVARCGDMILIRLLAFNRLIGAIGTQKLLRTGTIDSMIFSVWHGNGSPNATTGFGVQNFSSGVSILLANETN